MCDFCNSNSDQWKYMNIHIDIGEFGKLNFYVSITGGLKLLNFELAEDNKDPMWQRSLSINYCPYCGKELGTALMKIEDMKQILLGEYYGE